MCGTDTQARARERDLLFLSTPALWPAWPFLPLVRRAGGDGEEYGLLCDLMGKYGLAGFGAAVFLCNLFELPPSVEAFLALRRETFDTPEEVHQAGWRVD